MAKHLGTVLGSKKLADTIHRRAEATESLMWSLQHLSRERQYEIICGWMSLDRLEDLAAFQKTKDVDTPQGEKK